MNSTGRTGSQAARAATLLAPNTAAAVNAVDKTERYIGLSRQFCFRRSVPALPSTFDYFRASLCLSSPEDCSAIADLVAVAIVGIRSEHGIRVFGIIGKRCDTGARPLVTAPSPSP